MPIALALGAAALYGSADFLGGLASRRTAAAVVVVYSQVAGLVVLAIALALVPGRLAAGDLWIGLLGGIFGAVGIGGLYAALAVGRMGVVSPITAVIGAAVPVLFGILTGERPAAVALVGIALAFVAVALVSTNQTSRGFSLRAPGVAPAIFSGLAIGGLYIVLGRGHTDSGLWLLATTRLSSIPALLLYAFVRREALRPDGGSLTAIIFAGLLDMSSNILYVLAAHGSLLAIVAVLTSLYPATTVFLAWLVMHERLTPVQWIGVAIAVAGIGLIAAR